MEKNEYPHPFVHEVKLTQSQRLKGTVLGLFLFPIRISIASLCFLIMWPVARLRLAGLSAEERSRPVTGWRRWLFHPIIWLLSRLVFFSIGFHWLEVKGRRAGLREAPMLVAAPHSSFLDMLVLCPTQLATVVSRSENTSLPVIGALLEFNQSVLVSRKDPESRKNAIAQLNERLSSNGYWPQMLMFPEGTTTNGQVLIKFKRGAFLAGVPVQPVLLRYPNQLDTVRWTYKGTAWYETLWHTTSQLNTKMSVEFLPVYNPSEEEKNDPDLYADNVQKLMADALGLPATDYVMEGRVPVLKVGGLSLPVDSPARITLSLLHKNRVEEEEIKAALDRMMEKCQSGAWGSRVTTRELASILALEETQTTERICSLYSKKDQVDLRQVYFSISALAGFISLRSLLHDAFTMFSEEEKDTLSEEELSGLMGALMGFNQNNTAALYAEASSQGRLTEETLLDVLTSHLTYRKVFNEYLQVEKTDSSPPLHCVANGKAENNVHDSSQVPTQDRKLD
ncbi:unnamed protein product [Ophioblennius macclurei]